MKYKKETDLAEVVINYLTDLKWEVYQEVQPRPFGPCADIVAKQGPLIWVIECKLSFGLSVIEQAEYWQKYSHLVSVAVPYTRNDRMARRIVKLLGIGHLITEGVVTESLAPRLNRQASIQLLKPALIPERQTFAKAGNNNGDRWTPFKQTCLNVKDFVERNPDGVTVKELCNSITTHYRSPSTARTCLVRWIGDGLVPGVKLVNDGKLKVYPNKR